MLGLRLFTAICLFLPALLAADSPFVGTWKLNVAKSKDAPGTASKQETVVFEAVGGQWRRIAAGIDADGKPFKDDSTVTWDGKDHPTQEPSMTVAVSTLNENALKFTLKHEGKIVMVGRLVISKDGKTMTGYAKGADDKGRKIDSVDVYDKQ